MGLSVSGPSVGRPSAPQLFCGRENLPFSTVKTRQKNPTPARPILLFLNLVLNISALSSSQPYLSFALR